MSSNVAGLQTNPKKEPVAGPPFVAGAADNGLSVDPVSGRIVLGQAIGAPGDPAQLLSDREIFTGPFIIDLREDVTGVAGTAAILGITLEGTQGKQFGAFIQISNPALKEAIHTTNFGANAIGCVTTYSADLHSSEVGCFGNGFATVGLRNTAYIRSIGGLGSGPNVAVISGTTGNFAIWNNVPGLTEQYRFLNAASAVLDFPNTLGSTSSDLTIAVTGAIDGDEVGVGAPVGSIAANSMYWGFVSAPGVVTVRFCNFGLAAIDPAPGTFRVRVTGILRP